MKWGVSTTICKDHEIFTCIDALKDIPGVELRLRKRHFEYEEQDVVKRLKRRLKNLEIKPLSVHMPDRELNIAAIDEWKRVFSVREVEKAILVAHHLGAEAVVVHPGADKGHSEINAFRESMEELKDFAQEWGVRIVLENTFPGDFGYDIDTFGKLVQEMALQVCLDTSHGYSSGAVFKIMEQFRERIIHLHISDNRLRGKDDHLLPGEGEIDWDEFWGKMGKFDGILIFELMPAQDIQKRLKEIKEVMEKWEGRYGF